MALFGKDKKSAAKPAAPQSDSMQDLYKETAAKPSAKAGKTRTVRAGDASRILVRPLVTEKATNLASAGKYVFVVARQANKISVARAIEAAYGVKPTAVNLLNMEGKKVSRGSVRGQRSDWRKAIVTLKKGETIKIYEGV